MNPLDILLFSCAYLLRLFLVFYGELFAPPGVKYEDIDYEVFTNASRAIYEGGTAFECDTYRYTPLLAWSLQPNIWLSPHFGKLLFITMDIAAALLMHHLIEKYLSPIHRTSKINATVWLSVIWLFNPMIFTVTSRGSCDSVIILLVLGTFSLLLSEQWSLAGIIYGIAVHFRIYPFIYAPSFCLWIAHSTSSLNKPHSSQSIWSLIQRVISNVNVWRFGIISFCCFMALNTMCFVFMGGAVYVEESWMYHFRRIDVRHNFSPYFYILSASKLDSYSSGILTECVHALSGYEDSDPIGHCIAPLISRFAFVPQFGYIGIISLWYYRNLHLALFATTFVFVAWNKVCTAQYFLWYICLLPMVLPFLAPNLRIEWEELCCGHRMERVRSCWMGCALCIGLWAAANAHWLFWAMKYEILGEADKLLMVWIASIVFFVVNNVLLVVILRQYDSDELISKFEDRKKTKKQ